MTRLPFAARVAAGVAVTVVEEALKLPSTAVMFPMTVVSEALQRSMRFQQQVTALAIKGDLALASLPLIGSPVQEQPSWAVFDEDGEVDIPDHDTSDHDTQDISPDHNAADHDTPKPGRFALYSTPPLDEPVQDTAVKSVSSRPDVAELIDYDTLALAQLRARLRTLSVLDLETLLNYENDTLARAPFQTMLANRITTAKAK